MLGMSMHLRLRSSYWILQRSRLRSICISIPTIIIPKSYDMAD